MHALKRTETIMSHKHRELQGRQNRVQSSSILDWCLSNGQYFGRANLMGFDFRLYEFDDHYE